MINKLVKKVKQVVYDKYHLTISEVSNEFLQVPKQTLHITVTDLIFINFVEKQITDIHKTQRMVTALNFCKCNNEEGYQYLNRIVIEYE